MKIKFWLIIGVILSMTACKDDESPSPSNTGKGNDKIEITAIPSLEVSVNENLSAGTMLTTLVGLSPLGNVVLSIKSQTPAGAVALDDGSGKLTVAKKALFDFETNPVITVVVRGSVGSEWNEATVKINLIDLDELEPVQNLLNAGKMPWEIYASNIKYQDSVMIGRDFQGGVIYYYDEDKFEAFIVAKDNIGSATWGCKGTQISKPGTTWGAGTATTEAIAAECSDPNSAARKCLNLTLNGYSDWYLPMNSELTEIAFGPLGLELADKINWNEGDKFWSCTQYLADEAICVFVDIQGYATDVREGKDQSFLVRPVRMVKK